MQEHHARYSRDQTTAEELEIRKFQLMADQVCLLILTSDYPRIDIEIAKSELRSLCEELFPDKMQLYEMIYESRFQRLWEQFRGEDD